MIISMGKFISNVENSAEFEG